MPALPTGVTTQRAQNTYQVYTDTASEALLVGLLLLLLLVKVLVRWAEGERLTYRLPNLSLITLSPPGTDRILRVDALPHAVPIYGDPEAFLRFLT